MGGRVVRKVDAGNQQIGSHHKLLIFRYRAYGSIVTYPDNNVRARLSNMAEVPLNQFEFIQDSFMQNLCLSPDLIGAQFSGDFIQDRVDILVTVFSAKNLG